MVKLRLEREATAISLLIGLGVRRDGQKVVLAIKTQRLLPCAETAAMLFWALLASGQITMRRVDGMADPRTFTPDLDLAA